MFQLVVRVVFLIAATGYLVFYYNVSKAHRIALFDSVPSQTEAHELQYCFTDSDCEIVEWEDCSNCHYSKAVNKKYTDYFYDNADHYDYPIGFNQNYCSVITKLNLDEVPENRVECRGNIVSEAPLGAKCDRLLKQCYSVCVNSLGVEGKCKSDTYLNKFYDIFVVPLLYQDEEEQDT